MLVTLGARTQRDDLVDLLAACHQRIRQNLVLARRLAAEGPGRPIDEIRTTATQIRRYFALALPLHVADEDQTIRARLAGSGDAVATALERVGMDHLEHQGLVDRLVEACTVIEGRPEDLAARAPELARVVEALATQMATHLELEERVIFPALRQLSAIERSEIIDAIRRRRDNVLE